MSIIGIIIGVVAVALVVFTVVYNVKKAGTPCGGCGGCSGGKSCHEHRGGRDCCGR